MTDDLYRYVAGFDMQDYYNRVLVKANAALIANWARYQAGFHARMPLENLDAYMEIWWGRASAIWDQFNVAMCGQACPPEDSMLGKGRGKMRAAYVAKVESMKKARIPR